MKRFVSLQCLAALLVAVIVGFPLVIYWPTHLALERLFRLAR